MVENNNHDDGYYLLTTQNISSIHLKPYTGKLRYCYSHDIDTWDMKEVKLSTFAMMICGRSNWTKTVQFEGLTQSPSMIWPTAQQGALKRWNKWVMVRCPTDFHVNTSLPPISSPINPSSQNTWVIYSTWKSNFAIILTKQFNGSQYWKEKPSLYIALQWNLWSGVSV